MLVPCTSCGQPVAVHERLCPSCGEEHPARQLDRENSTSAPWQVAFRTGLASIAREDYSTALEQLGKAIVDAPQAQLAQCHATRGYAYLCLEQYERALSDCDEAIKLAPHDAQATAWRGSALAGLSHWREAVDCLKMAIELSPDSALDYEQVALAVTEDALPDFRRRVKDGDASFQLFYDRGVVYAFRGDLNKAIRDFTQAIEANSSYAPAYCARARCLFEVDRRDEAMADCEAAIELGFKASEVFRLRSEMAEDTGDLNLAIGDLNTLISRQPNDILSLRRRAQLHTRKQRFDLANRDYTLALRHDSGQDEMYVARGIVRCELGDYWGAIDDFSRSLEKVSDAETLALRGEAKLALARTKQALVDFDAALRLNSACTSARRGRALVYSATGRHDQALELIERALRVDPRYGLGMAAKGRIHQELQQFDKAIEAYSQAIEIIGDGRGAADTRYRRGVCFATRESWEEAANDFDEAIGRRKTHAGSYVWRANVRLRTGAWRSALDDLIEAGKLNPTHAPHYQEIAKAACQNVIEALTKSLSTGDSAEKYRNRGIVCQFVGQSKAALEDFNYAIDRDPGDAAARVHRAAILRELGDNASALGDYDAVGEKGPRDASYWLERAACQLGLGKVEQALADVTSAIELDSHVPDAYVQRATIQLRLGRVSSAIADLDQAICLAPQRPEAYYERAQIRVAKKQPASAIQDLNRAIDRAPHLHQAVILRAELLSRAGDTERALKDFESAVALVGSVQAHCGRALTLARLGRHDVAMRELTKVLRLFDGGDLATLLSCRAKIGYNAGLFRRAISDFEASLKVGLVAPQQQGQSLYGRGLAFYQLQDKSRAKESIRQAVAVDPQCQPAVAALNWLVGKAVEKPGPIDPPRTSVKLSAPPRLLPPVEMAAVKYAEAAEQWKTDPPWNLWLVGSADNDIEFGPVELSVLDQWCRQGRIGEQTLVLRADWDEWKWASDIYRQLGGASRALPQKDADIASTELGNADSGDRLAFPRIEV